MKLNGRHHKHNFPTYYVDIKSCTKTKSDSAIFFLKLYVITPATVSVLVWFVFVFVCVFICLISFCKHSIQKNSSARCRKNRCFNNSKSSCKFHNWCSVYGRISCKKFNTIEMRQYCISLLFWIKTCPLHSGFVSKSVRFRRI